MKLSKNRLQSIINEEIDHLFEIIDGHETNTRSDCYCAACGCLLYDYEQLTPAGESTGLCCDCWDSIYGQYENIENVNEGFDNQDLIIKDELIAGILEKEPTWSYERAFESAENTVNGMITGWGWLHNSIRMKHGLPKIPARLERDPRVG